MVSGTVDFGTFGIAAAILGAAVRQPIVVIGSECNKGMAIVAGKNSGIDKLADLKGKRVAIWPGSTQEVFVLERLKMEGMSVRDITPVRVSFSEMHAALARGDVDAYVGAEPGPGLSVSSGIGKIVEYPYSTRDGQPQHDPRHQPRHGGEAAGARAPDCDLQRQASAYAMSNPDAMVAMTVAKLGMQQAGGRGGGAECRAELADDAGDDPAGQDLCRPDAGAEADPRAAGFRDLLRHALLRPGRRRRL